MVTPEEQATRVAFGLFELDLQTGELWKAGFRVRVQSQPFKVLTALVAKPGEIVTRDELQLLVWGPHTTVDFDRSLGTAINKLREALGDSADNPRFIETLAKRGYRFIAPVTVTARHTAGGAMEALPLAEGPPEALPLPVTGTMIVMQADGGGSGAMPGRWRFAGDWMLWGLLAGGVMLAVALGVLAGQWSARTAVADGPLRVDQLTRNSRISPGAPNMESLAAFATDGVRIYTSVLEEGRPQLAVIDIASGEVSRVAMPSELVSVSLADLSQDGSRLLLRGHLSTESEQPVWIVPTTGGSALRVGNVLAHDAIWMPDGKSVLYASGNDLAISHLQDGGSTPYATLPGRAFWMRWSPDGKLLRFTIMDTLTHISTLWELEAGSRTPRPLLKNWTYPSSECCGTWTADGSAYIFQSSHAGTTDLWEMRGTSRNATPLRLTNGPMNYGSPVAARSGHRIYFLGLDPQSEMQRLSADGKEFVPERDFLSEANRIDYSRDKRWVAWTDSDGRLWRARAADGAEKIQLTPDYLQVFLAHWSPDGSKLALMAREDGKAWQIYQVGAEGGSPEALLTEKRNSADPGWSPDGRSLVFGREPDQMGKESGSHMIELMDLASRQVTTLPGSEGLFSPRWSPDGRWIAALTLDQKRVMLFDTVARQWKELAATSAADPVWSTDSKALYVHASLASKQPILRISVPSGELTQVASLDSFRSGSTADYFFVGMTPEDVPMVRARFATGNLFTLNLDRR